MSELKGEKILYLKEDGANIRGQAGKLSGDAVFILGDHLGMTPEEEASIEQVGAEMVSIGPASLHADHCIVQKNYNGFNNRYLQAFPPSELLFLSDIYNDLCAKLC